MELTEEEEGLGKELAEAGDKLDEAIGVALMEIIETVGLSKEIQLIIVKTILPAQLAWREAAKKAK